MSLTDLIWISTMAYGVHMLEEFMLDWRDWARAVIGLPVEWHDFYVTNSLVVLLGIVCANLADTQPALALALPALMLINATFFHIAPMVKTHGRYSPGVTTAVLLFYPIGIACFWRAISNGSVTTGGVVLSFVIGAALMASPIVLLRVRGKPYFKQS